MLAAFVTSNLFLICYLTYQGYLAYLNLRSSWLEYGKISTIKTQAKLVILSREELITTSSGDFLFWQNEMARET
jgi:uncharacterized membrane protein YozB (DUF420 family)